MSSHHDIAMVPTAGPQSDPNSAQTHLEDDVENKYLDEKAAYGGADIEAVDPLEKHLQDTQDMEVGIDLLMRAGPPHSSRSFFLADCLYNSNVFKMALLRMTSMPFRTITMSPSKCSPLSMIPNLKP